jgi:hypothetical protein
LGLPNLQLRKMQISKIKPQEHQKMKGQGRKEVSALLLSHHSAKCNVGNPDTEARAGESSQISHGETRILGIRRANSMIYCSDHRS